MQDGAGWGGVGLGHCTYTCTKPVTTVNQSRGEHEKKKVIHCNTSHFQGRHNTGTRLSLLTLAKRYIEFQMFSKLQQPSSVNLLASVHETAIMLDLSSHSGLLKLQYKYANEVINSLLFPLWLHHT